MKTIKYVFISMAIFLISCSQNNKKIIGEWRGTTEGEKVSFVFDKNYNASIIWGNLVLGGKDYDDNGTKRVCKYEIDFSKNPIWLDIVIYESGKSVEQGRIKGIVKFITENKIEYRSNFEGDRYEKFDVTDISNTIVFDKVKN